MTEGSWTKMDLSYITKNTKSVMGRIREAERQAGRPEGCVRMIAAVKYAEPEELVYLCEQAGVRDLGENRVQQLLAHYEAMEHPEEYRWHFIGSLQTNKVKYISDKVTLIHSLDSLRLADEIEKQAAKRGIITRVLVEINSGNEENKGGIEPGEVERFCLDLQKYRSIELCGFMTMAPRCENRSDYYGYFSRTKKIADEVWTKALGREGDPIISMGMSESFEEAIECGATVVRIGRTLFHKE